MTSQYVVKSYAAPVRVPSFSAKLNASTYSEASYYNFLGGTVALWDTASGALETQLDLFDYFNPVDHAVASSVYSTGEVDCDVRADDWHEPLVEVLDWAHVSSVAAGVEDNWLVTLRNLNAVVSLRRNATASANSNATATNATSSRLMWTLSASLPSDFAFENEDAKFYQPHSVEQLPNGDVLLLDIRTPREWKQTGVSPLATPLNMRERSFGADLMALIDGNSDQPVALICASGGRSGYLAQVLSEAGFSEVYDVTEGMIGSGAGPGWIGAGLPVVDFDPDR